MKKPKTLALAAALGLQMTGGQAAAESLMFSYNTLLSKTDAVNSSGAPLEGWCALLQQDRANYHRFIRRDSEDESDPFFNTPDRRAMMTGKCEANPNIFKDPGAQIRSGAREFHLTVQVFGNGQTVTRIRTADAF